MSSTAKVQSDIWSILGNKNKVSLNILNDENISVVKDVSGKDVVIVQVPEAEDSQKPIYLNGKIDMAFVRKGEGDQKVDNDLLQAMLRNASSSVDSGMQKLYSINDIDPISLATFKSIVSSRYEEKNYAGLSDMQFLTEIGLFRTDRTDGLTYPTLSAILMLGKYNSIRELIPSFHLDYIDYRDTVERWSDRVASDEPSLREMNLYNFFSIVNDKLTATVKTPFSLGSDNVRIDKSLEVALREALVNTLVHADYLTPKEYVKIEVYKSWYSFKNPGKMLISEAEYVCGGVSKVRNEILMKCFRLLGLSERQGMGGKEILKAAMNLKFRRPEIKTSFFYTSLVFWKTDIVDSHTELTETAKKVFAYIINNGTSSRKDIAKATGIPDRQIRSALESLMACSLVNLTGKGPATRYCLHERSMEKKAQIQKGIYELIKFLRI